MNDQGAFDAASNRFVAPAAGTYQFGASLLNTLATPDLIQFYLADSGARIVLCEHDLIDRFSLVETSGTRLEKIVVANAMEAPDGERLHRAADFIDGQPETLACADTGPDDMAFWMYSSGSTGRPKGIVHLQHDMAYTQLSFGKHLVGLRAGDICYSVPKMFFAYGFGNSATFPFSVGATSLLVPGRPEADRVLDAIETFVRRCSSVCQPEGRRDPGGAALFHGRSDRLMGISTSRSDCRSSGRTPTPPRSRSSQR